MEKTVQTVTNALAGLDKMTSVKRATRRGKTRTGGRRSCTLMVCFLFAAMLLMVDVVRAVFAPADRAALKAAVGTCTSSGFCAGGCLGETADGSCPTFAASNVPGTGNPYGVMGDWDVSKVTSMRNSTSTSVSTLFVHWTVSLICFFDFFLIHPVLFVFCILSCPPPFVSIVFYVSGGG